MAAIRHTNTQSIAALAESAFLRKQLADAFAHVRRKHVLVGFFFGGESSHALVSDVADMQAPFVMPAGCLAKLFTATLAKDACAAGWFNRADLLADLLATAAKRDALAGVTIRHLLEHTHGLDDSMIDRAPLRLDGFIDTDGLLTQLSAVQRLAAPGELYSYANVGAWLIAALLERCSGQRYEVLLRDRLLAPLNIAAQRRADVCPSLGGTLAVSVVDMLEFLRRHGLGSPEQWPGDGQPGVIDEIVPLPGWNALERGVYLGWKYHGGGWFGHNSTWPGASALVRVQPQRGIALVIASRDQPASLVAAKLFGRLLPELVDLRIPQPLSADETRHLDLRRYIGVYRSAARSVSISKFRSGLRLNAHRLDSGGTRVGRSVDATLRAARDNVFFTQPADTESFPYVQFVAPRAHTFQYLWNGRFVLPRV